MAVGISNVQALGRCGITFKSTDLGIAEGCKATIQVRTHLITCEAGGPAPLHAKNAGIGIEVEAVFLETEFDVLKAIISDNLTKVVGTATTGTKLTAGGVVDGEDANYGALTVIPKAAGLVGYSLLVHKAVVMESDPEFTFQAEEKLQGGFMIKWVGLLDTTKTDGDMLFAFGVTGASVA